MYKVKNTKVEIKQGLNKKVMHNRLLDNYLNWIIYRILPTSVANTLFPQFEGVEPLLIPMVSAYLKFNTQQTVLDTDTTMDFDKQNYDIDEMTSTVDVYSNKAVINLNYFFDTLGLAEGDTYEGLGFGQETETYTNYLFSFINIGVANERFNPNTPVTISRCDEIETNETLLHGGNAGFLPTATRTVTLDKIIMCYGENGEKQGKEYDVSLLNFEFISAGNVEMSGFYDFYIENNLIYPSTFYPNEWLSRNNHTEIVKHNLLGGIADGGVIFNGTNDYAISNINKEILCIEADFEISSFGATYQGVVSTASLYTHTGFSICVNPRGMLYVWYGTGTEPISVNIGPTLALNTRYNILIQYKNGILEVYKNGDLVFTKALTIATTNSAVALGRAWIDFSNYCFNGRIYSARAYSAPLSATEISQNYEGNIAENGLELWAEGIDFYPSPKQPGKQIKSVIFKYGKYQTYLNVKDLDANYNEKGLTINLKCERSEY